MRPIDADYLKEEMDAWWCPDMTVGEIWNVIDHAPTVGGWISVKDRMPDAAGYACLVCATNVFGQQSVFIAFTGYGDFKWYTMDTTKIGKFVHGDNEVSEAWTITHWQPLPNPPKEESK